MAVKTKRKAPHRGAGRARVRIGTSGWNYNHWQGPFYDESLPSKDWLEFYAEKFQSVEINNSFYQLPAKKTIKSWRDTVDDDFVFAIKASRYITHMKKLKDPRESTPKFFNVADELKDKLGPILFQLPPKWNCNVERLDEFLRSLPEGYRYVFEFRDESWWRDDVYELLREYGAAFCIFDLKGRVSPREVTADFVYVRLHGPSETAYQGSYDNNTLSGWAGAFSSWRNQGHDVCCFFDNDQNGYAARNALQMRNML